MGSDWEWDYYHPRGRISNGLDGGIETRVPHPSRVIPDRKGCPSPNGMTWFRGKLHQWNWRSNWNGNSSKVFPFPVGSAGFARSGWRCYHCGTMVWDETDLQYVADYARGVHGIDAMKLIGDAVEAKSDPRMEALERAIKAVEPWMHALSYFSEFDSSEYRKAMELLAEAKKNIG